MLQFSSGCTFTQMLEVERAPVWVVLSSDTQGII